VPSESSCRQEWVSGEVTKRDIGKERACWGRGVCLHGGGQEFLFLPKSLKCLSLVPPSLHGASVNNIPPSPCGRRQAKQDVAE